VGSDGCHVNVNIIVIIGVIYEGGKRILHISVLAGHVCRGVEAALVRFLDERIQVGRDLMIPLFEIALVQAASKKESDGIVKELHESVWIVPQYVDLLTILDSAEEDFRCVVWGIHTSVVCVILEEHIGLQTTIRCNELVQDGLNLYQWIPSCKVGIR
jgi:hypothetical protein